MNLSPYQRTAISHRQGPALVLSGPGGAKTTTIVERVADLLRDGLRVERVLCVTFAKDAAEEMRRRIARITGISENTLCDSVSTFHSLALRILRNSGEEFTLSTPTQVGRMLREFVRKDRVYEQRSFNSRMRRGLISPERAMEYAETEAGLGLAEAYGKYDVTLREEQAIDFDSMVYRAWELLSHDPTTLESYRQRFRHVIIDEGHDTDFGQMELVKMIASGKNSSLMTIFDGSQQIYSFRGADAQALIKSANGAARYFLPINYRSHSEIIEAFKPFAERDELSWQLVSKMEAARGTGGTVELHSFYDDFMEAEAVCQEIRDSGLAPKDHAVLARTRALLLNCCEELQRMGIDYEWRGRNFWASPEIEDAVAFCRLAIDPTDRKAWFQTICSPAACAKYLGRRFALAVTASTMPPLKIVPQGDWKEYQIEQWSEMRETVKSLGRIAGSTPPDFLRGMIMSAGLGVFDSQNDEPDDFRRDNLDALIRRAERFGTLLEFVRHAEQMKSRKRSTTAKGVTLSTIHAAKGLEFAQTFVIGLTEGILPHKRSEDFSEERRLVYVALSRAKDRLWMSYHGKKSVFVNYLPETIQEVSHMQKLEAEA